MALKTIELTQGQIGIIDEADSERLSGYSWHAIKCGSRFYVAATVKNDDGTQRMLRLHRYLTNAEKGEQVDHINGNGLDNRRSNLRVCSHQQNQWNRRLLPKNSSTGFQGVNYNKANRNFRAAIKHNKQSIHLGVFDTKEAAHEAYKAASIQLKGEFSPYYRQGR